MFSRTVGVVLALVSLTACENDGGGKPRATKVQSVPELTLRASADCGCQGAQKIVAINNSSIRQKLTYKMLLEQLDTQRSCVFDEEVSIGDKSEQTLGCTITDVDSGILNHCPGFSENGGRI